MIFALNILHLSIGYTGAVFGEDISFVMYGKRAGFLIHLLTFIITERYHGFRI